MPIFQRAISQLLTASLSITASGITDKAFTLDWTPVGSGNYNITYSGTTSGTILNATPPATIGGALPDDGNYTVTITQTGVPGSCPASGTITVHTLCLAPVLTATPAATAHAIPLSWTGPTAGVKYRVFYRALYTSGFNSLDVTNATTATITKLGGNVLPGGATYEIYVTRLDCPTTNAVGQASNIIHVTTPPLSACDVPVIDAVTSTCPVQLEVTMHGSSSNQYYVYLQRLTPTLQPVNIYGVSGNNNGTTNPAYFTINSGSAGQSYLIAIAARCGSTIGNLVLWPTVLQVKPTCNTLNNLTLSNATCHGFTASWNSDPCQSNTLSNYQLYLRQQGSLVWNSYPVAAPTPPVGPFKLVNWLSSNRTYEVFVRSNYACNGYISWGPASQILTVTTLSSGCKDGEELQPDQPAAQQFSADQAEVLSLYPNPNNGQFEVDLSRISTDEEQVRIEVTNLIGQTVLTHMTSLTDGHMNEYIYLPQSAASGTYIVKITAGKNVYTTKMNISR